MLDLAVVPPKSHWFDMLNAPEGFNAEAEDLWKVVQKREDNDGKQKWECLFCMRQFALPVA
ncbi:hypothetical protein M885DRAFT_566120 [Pelagophyceae sp. CCMP2097]|nr:hypothetical protein M885DRAFT_566120 [Pelagophyceae sp. CCMP2097]